MNRLISPSLLHIYIYIPIIPKHFKFLGITVFECIKAHTDIRDERRAIIIYYYITCPLALFSGKTHEKCNLLDFSDLCPFIVSVGNDDIVDVTHQSRTTDF